MTLLRAAALALVVVAGSAEGPAVAADTILHVGATPPPHGYPADQDVRRSRPPTFAPGRAVRGSVETTDNVHYVEARVEYRSVAMHEDAPGKFSLTYTVPWWLPPWLRHAATRCRSSRAASTASKPSAPSRSPSADARQRASGSAAIVCA